MKKIKLRWCAEEDEYININKCDGTKDCSCDCDEADGYKTYQDITSIVQFDRSLPEENEPTTYLFTSKNSLTKLPFIIEEILKKEPHANIYIIFEDILIKEQPNEPT
jgi:hypothetical protein